MKNAMKTIATGFFLTVSLIASAEKINVEFSTESVPVDVKDPAALATLGIAPGGSIKIDLLTGEDKAFFEEFKQAKLQAKRVTLIQYIKDVSDDKTEKHEVTRFTDLPTALQKELTKLATLREQLALNWADEEIVARGLKNPSVKEIAKLIGTEVTVLIDQKDVEAYYASSRVAVQEKSAPKARTKTPTPKPKK